jgi:CheY-like chemotaxis protein
VETRDLFSGMTHQAAYRWTPARTPSTEHYTTSHKVRLSCSLHEAPYGVNRVIAQDFAQCARGPFAPAYPTLRGRYGQASFGGRRPPMIRKMLCQLFEREENYDICAEAQNGQEAIDLALKHRPDLIILDFAMPVLNGLDAARRLKKIMPEVPVILFTQHARAAITTLDIVDRIVPKTDAIGLMEHVKSLSPA